MTKSFSENPHIYKTPYCFLFTIKESAHMLKFIMIVPIKMTPNILENIILIFSFSIFVFKFSLKKENITKMRAVSVFHFYQPVFLTQISYYLAFYTIHISKIRKMDIHPRKLTRGYPYYKLPR